MEIGCLLKLKKKIMQVGKITKVNIFYKVIKFMSFLVLKKYFYILY